MPQYDVGLFPAWTWVVGLLLGATIGSFLNVVIYRMPRGLSLSRPKHSFCPKCKHQLGVPDLFPLFSWLFSRGRCRYCRERVHPRYFLVELLTGGIWAGIWYQYLIADNEVAKAVTYALAASALVAIIFIDFELYVIPDQINAFLAFVGIGYNIYLYWEGNPAAATWGIPSSIAGWIVGVGVLWGIALLGRLLFRKDSMGHGDIKMARGIGAVLFPAVAMMSFGLAVVAGMVFGIAMILSQIAADRREAGNAPAPNEAEAEEEEEYEPESYGSLFKSGFGYMVGLDIVGLAAPKFYQSYFGENPYEPYEDLEDFEPERTMIPFGPFLAMGAIAATVFSQQLLRLWENYLNFSLGK